MDLWFKKQACPQTLMQECEIWRLLNNTNKLKEANRKLISILAQHYGTVAASVAARETTTKQFLARMVFLVYHSLPDLSFGLFDVVLSRTHV